MALKCQKKVRVSSRKKAQLLRGHEKSIVVTNLGSLILILIIYSPYDVIFKNEKFVKRHYFEYGIGMKFHYGIDILKTIRPIFKCRFQTVHVKVHWLEVCQFIGISILKKSHRYRNI